MNDTIALLTYASKEEYAAVASSCHDAIQDCASPAFRCYILPKAKVVTAVVLTCVYVSVSKTLTLHLPAQPATKMTVKRLEIVVDTYVIRSPPFMFLPRRDGERAGPSHPSHTAALPAWGEDAGGRCPLGR